MGETPHCMLYIICEFYLPMSRYLVATTHQNIRVYGNSDTAKRLTMHTHTIPHIRHG